MSAVLAKYLDGCAGHIITFTSPDAVNGIDFQLEPGALSPDHNFSATRESFE
jgi:hypothetical protein